MSHRSHPARSTLAAVLGIGCCGSAHAIPQGYTDFSLFQTDASKYSVIEHTFNDATPDTIITDGSIVDGITFSAINLADSRQMMVSSLYGDELTSPPLGIGTDSPDSDNDNQFQNPDNFVLTFPASNVFGVWFISREDNLFLGDFRITVSGAVQPSTEAPYKATANGANAWFIGFIDDASPFTTAAIATYDEDSGNFFFRIDDVYTSAGTAPEPATFTLLAAGIAFMGWRRMLGVRRTRSA